MKKSFESVTGGVRDAALVYHSFMGIIDHARGCLKPFFAALVCLVIAGCDMFDLDATRVVAGTVIRSPSIPAPEGGLAQSEVTAASAFVGDDEYGLLVPPVGVIGADVHLTIFAQGESVRDVQLFGLGDGNYTVTSVEDPDLVYMSGASYRLEVEELGDLYEVDVGQAPTPEAPQGLADGHRSGEPLTVTRSQMYIAFLEVLRLEGGGATQTWTNRPSGIQETLDVLFDPSPYQASSFDIPGEAFPQPGQYAIVLITGDLGEPDINLHPGSNIVVGAGEARIISVE